MTQLAIIADDLTGAADSAALFAEAGLATVIPLHADPTITADVLSISTESRDHSPENAAIAVRAAISGLSRCGGGLPALLYKKVDSALRGQIRAELIAAMETTGQRRAIFAPALPAEGRATIGGRQFVHGVPLEQSSFGGDGTTSDLIATLASPAGGDAVRLVELSALRTNDSAVEETCACDGIVIADAETENDLDLIAHGALQAGVSLLAGSAGLARALERAGGFRPVEQAPGWSPAHGKPLLVVAGTRHPATARQIAMLADRGVVIVRPDQAALGGLTRNVDTQAIERELCAGHHVVLTTEGCPHSRLAPSAVAELLATVVDSAIVRATAGGMLLTGGDVAAAVCNRLSASAIWLRGEVRPAIPWGTLSGGKLPGFPIVTKAGSFGDDAVLFEAIEHLSNAL